MQYGAVDENVSRAKFDQRYLGKTSELEYAERTSLLILHLLTAKAAALDKVACKALPDWDRVKA
jgi:hypothetical protein